MTVSCRQFFPSSSSYECVNDQLITKSFSALFVCVANSDVKMSSRKRPHEKEDTEIRTFKTAPVPTFSKVTIEDWIQTLEINLIPAIMILI